jgi:GxxExxY protein
MALELENLTGPIIGAAVDVLRELGPGFVEKIYEEAMAAALQDRGLRFERQLTVPVHFRGRRLGAHRLDLLIEGLVVVELKAVVRLEDVHRAVVLSYLRATSRRVGLLINFKSALLQRERILNPLAPPAPSVWESTPPLLRASASPREEQR